ncbi:MAG: aspartyl/glutamyl-tRNA amidotransferase subunit C [Synergistaceae bacterium]|nr:aspartyl/glutamyl-tRNA amidotransferase subunit C [Synergistaceae bacterium]
MTEKMEMDKERLLEVLGFSCIGLPEEEYTDVLGRVNAVLRMCDDMQELDISNVSPFEWDVRKVPSRREDKSVVWKGRDRFLDQAPVKEGDFFRVPRIMAKNDDEMEGEE